MKNFLMAAFAAFVLAQLAFAQAPAIENGDVFTQAGNLQGYGPLANSLIIAIAGMAFAASLIYMASKAMHVAEWEMYTKGELFQIFIGVLWGIGILAGAIVVDGIANDYAAGLGMRAAGQGIFGIGQEYLQDTICLSSAATLKLEGLKLAAQYMAGMKGRFYASASGWGFSYQMFPGFDVIDRMIGMVEMFITPFAASLIVQRIGLQIIHATALTIVVPAGILMRVFPPTRDAGSFLIASALAFYFILPFCYLINAHVMGFLYQEEFKHAMCSGGDAQGQDYFFSTKDFYSSLGVQMLPDVSEDIIRASTSLSYVAVQAVFLPALNMIMAVTFITAGAKFFSQKLE
ncbi:MAG: hypothetical protein V1822_02115 [Candidatus Micrarchaeota archaeon]